VFTTQRSATCGYIGLRPDGMMPRRASVTVELALVVPLLVFLLFAILEFGFLMKNRAELGQAAREGARQAAVGATPTRVDAEIASATQTIESEHLTRLYRFRSWDEGSGTWGSWQTLGVNDGENNASQGDQVQIRLTYQHRLLLPGLMGSVMNAGDDGRVAVVAATVMMRE